jgi:protein-L-isoaspartate O-methyltransferase
MAAPASNLPLFWLPPNASASMRATHLLVNHCKDIAGKWATSALTQPIPNDAGSPVNLGLSFKTYPVDSECCMEVTMRYISNAREPAPIRVADVGAGLGYMARMLTLFGAHVTAIERHKPAAEVARKTIDAITAEFRRLGSTATAADVVRLVCGDVCGNYFGRLREEYDVIHCSRVIHQQHPRDVHAFLRRLFALLRPGGTLFVSAHAPGPAPRHSDFVALPSEQPSMLQRYRERAKAGVRFPGFIATRSTCTKLAFASHREGPAEGPTGPSDPTKRSNSERAHGPTAPPTGPSTGHVGSEGPEGPSPSRSYYPLQYNGTQRVDVEVMTDAQETRVVPGSNFWLDANGVVQLQSGTEVHDFVTSEIETSTFVGDDAWKQRAELPSRGTLVTYTSCLAMLVFDLPELEREVRSAGFDIVHASYVGTTGHLLTTAQCQAMTDATLEADEHMVWVKAKKGSEW